MFNIQQIMEKLDDDIIIDIMAELGTPVYEKGTTSDGATYMMFNTVCHNGDSHKLQYYSNTKTFHCWTNCGTMSIFDLVGKVNHYSGKSGFYQSLAYVAYKVGVKDDSDNRTVLDYEVQELLGDHNKLLRKLESLELYTNESFSTEISTFYDPKILNLFDEKVFYKGWLEEGISFESMEKFGIRYYSNEHHIIIPHYNIDGKLVGIRRRSLKPEDSNNKYMPEYINNQSYEHQLGLNLYGLYENKNAIVSSKTVVVTEGEKSVLLSDSYFQNESVAVATCGFNITQWQISQLRSLGVQTVYLAFDKDYDLTSLDKYHKDPKEWSGLLNYCEKLTKITKNLSAWFDVYIILDRSGLLNIKDSPFDKGKKVYEKLKQRAIFIDDNFVSFKKSFIKM